MNNKGKVFVTLTSLILTGAISAGCTYFTEAYMTEPQADMLKDVDTSASDERDQAASLIPKALMEEIKSKYAEATKVNSDIIGWIYIPNSNVDYPICSGNNNYYLNYSWDKKKSKEGSIFLDEAQYGFSKLSMIHGHNMKNKTMFSTLKNYKDETFFKKNCVYIYTGDTFKVFRPMGWLRVGENTTFDLDVPDGPTAKAYVEDLCVNSAYGEPPVPVTEDDVIILNTCVSDGSGDHYILVGQEITGNGGE